MENRKFIVRGIVKNFSGEALAHAQVAIMNNKFEPIYETTSNENGEYELEVEEGLYNAFAAVKDYRVNNLEYWEWNVPVFSDLEINPRIDKLEVYAVNAFRPQGAYPSFLIYFRPMSLIKAGALYESGEIEKVEIINISPDLNKEGIEVEVNSEKVEILEINRTLEFSDNNQHMYGYLVQTSLPENYKADDYNRIHITLTDSESGEKGEGCCYWKKDTK